MPVNNRLHKSYISGELLIGVPDIYINLVFNCKKRDANNNASPHRLRSSKL